jgi:hypothetical protein
MAQVIGCLFSKNEALSLSPTTEKLKQKKRKNLFTFCPCPEILWEAEFNDND